MLELRDVHKVYDTRRGRRHVLRGVDCAFRKGDAVGILGRNGAGKSTLIRIMSGAEHPTRGEVRRGMSVSWPLGFGGAVHHALTGADNIRFIARIYGRPFGWTLGFVEEFAELGDYLHMPVRTYSAGMETRLAFALSLAVEFDCYLVDEVVAAGDARFADRCRQALLERRGQSALLMVSHSPDILRAFCDTGATLHEGRLTFHEDLDQAIAAYRAL
jgi:capsular polysaccharide transport system ATP-binding protein